MSVSSAALNTGETAGKLAENGPALGELIFYSREYKKSKSIIALSFIGGQ